LRHKQQRDLANHYLGPFSINVCVAPQTATRLSQPLFRTLFHWRVCCATNSSAT